ncbi:DEAD/DEAH box helicase [Pararhizobium mangrovi]|uniref:Transcription-repair-coupling factor n=1 Tax=Pararhizobium mangrovi TaxID=2590452 RepID=A0A506U5F2_9HYPH|nr:DEAD/DEAH box helicase [Pararhizobium mangrovi]TPW28678.1 DEAD/DEAH box helicase [Pararhizobium mangrovi]
MLKTATLDSAKETAEELSPLQPVGAVAAMIARHMRAEESGPLVYVASTGRRRREIAGMLDVLLGGGEVAQFPAVEGYPGDGIEPGAAAMGGRTATLRWLMDADHRPSVVVTTPAALIRRVPPREALRGTHLEIRVGEAIDLEETKTALLKLGYRLDERVDEPGEAAIRGRVIEVFPAAAPRPCRVEHEDGTVTAIRSYDDATQRSVAESELLIIDPASEFLPAGDEDEEGDAPSFLCRYYAEPASFFDHLPDGEIILEERADIRASEVFAILDDLPVDETHAKAIREDHLDGETWSREVGARLSATVTSGKRSSNVPVFALEKHPYRAFADFAEPLAGKGYRVVVAGSDRRELRTAAGRAARMLKRETRAVASWAEVLDAEPGDLLVLEAPVTEGFLAHDDRIAIVCLRDLAGQRADGGASAEPELFAEGDEVFAIGDVVVHLDHGLGILDGLETIDDGEALSLRYADDDTLLVPMSDIAALWRYGGPASQVKLDRLKGKQWLKRRDEIMTAISDTAERMVELLKARQEAKASRLEPDRARYERFCARFAFEMTKDQASATAAVLDDLASGRPMDRLVCGDVGYGKTEVALRAAAAAVFAGKQVAVVAPTTVLAQQHFRTFSERFAPQGVSVARLSRLADKEEAEEAKAGLADGSVQIVVGSHAVLSDDVSFTDLALVVIDEEQRFGAEQKQRMRSLADELHVLTMTATPIPRTLQAGFVGLHDVSIVATAPVSRRPVKTMVGPFDAEKVGEALRTERKRGGQSFVVCPRIEDLDAMEDRLQAIAPELEVRALHGKMEPDAIDEAMLAFSRGEGDVLLATGILESGLDVPRANTMIVWRPDRFGLSQLHQLRGRVGRATRRGTVVFATDPDEELSEGAKKRLIAIEELSSLGAGFDIAGRDLDLRGTGELLGDEQAGHLQTIGIGLYRRTLERALALARDDRTAPDEWRPTVDLGARASIPADYVPEPDLRIELAILLERIEDLSGLKALRSEIEDRFGAMPQALETQFALATMRLRCQSLAVRALDGGPKAVAASFGGKDAERVQKRLGKPGRGLRWSGTRLVRECKSETAEERLKEAEALLDAIEG